MRTAIAVAVVLSLAACSAGPGSQVAGDVMPNGYNPAVAATLNQQYPWLKSTPPATEQQAAAAAPYQQAAIAAEQRARAECAYQAKVANMTTPGIIGGFGAGLGVGGACLDYYRQIGVIR